MKKTAETPVAEEKKTAETPVEKEKEDRIIAEIMAKTPKKLPKYAVKDGGKDTFLVVDKITGAVARVYKKIEGCDNPKESAEQYTEKLNK